VLFQQIRQPWRPLGKYGAGTAQWRHPVALSEALGLIHWAMGPTSFHMAIEIASDLPAFFVVLNLLFPTTIAK
jgi:hypothetical protein